MLFNIYIFQITIIVFDINDILLNQFSKDIKNYDIELKKSLELNYATIKQRNIFGILLNQTEIDLPPIDLEPTGIPFVFQINWKMVNTI